MADSEISGIHDTNDVFCSLFCSFRESRAVHDGRMVERLHERSLQWHPSAFSAL
jgi:hypothetical protein